MWSPCINRSVEGGWVSSAWVVTVRKRSGEEVRVRMRMNEQHSDFDHKIKGRHHSPANNAHAAKAPTHARTYHLTVALVESHISSASYSPAFIVPSATTPLLGVSAHTHASHVHASTTITQVRNGMKRSIQKSATSCCFFGQATSAGTLH